MDEPRRRGRPQRDPSKRLSASVTTWLTEETFDRLCRVARAERRSLSDVVRNACERIMPPREFPLQK